MKILKTEIRENGKYLILAIGLFGILSCGFMAHRKWSPATYPYTELAEK